MSETCETCRFWTGRVVGNTYTPGPCRRFPPVTEEYRITRLGPDYWCGEYQKHTGKLT